jgi:uncharacterized membrane protein YhdT
VVERNRFQWTMTQQTRKSLIRAKVSLLPYSLLLFLVGSPSYRTLDINFPLCFLSLCFTIVKLVVHDTRLAPVSPITTLIRTRICLMEAVMTRIQDRPLRRPAPVQAPAWFPLPPLHLIPCTDRAWCPQMLRPHQVRIVETASDFSDSFIFPSWFGVFRLVYSFVVIVEILGTVIVRFRTSR